VGGDSSIYGGQLVYHLNRSQSEPSWIAANYFQESLGIRNFILYGANALISFGEKTQLIAEYARSQNDSEILGAISGSAMRFDLNTEFGTDILGKLYYSKAETGFANNATISFVPGQTRYGAQLSAKLSPTTNVQLRYDQEENTGVAPRPLTSLTDLLNVGQDATPGSAIDNSLRTISFGLQQNIGSALLNLDLLYRDREDRRPPNTLTSSSTQLRSRLTLPITDNIRFSAQNEVSLAATADAVIPDRSVMSLDWTIVQGLTARIGQQWFHTGTLAGNSITSADLLGEYKLGTDTTLTGRYSVIGASNSTSTQGALGLNQRWQISSGLKLNFGYEHVFGSSATTTTTGTSFLQPFAVGQSSTSVTSQSGHSYNIGAEYSDNPDFKASARFEQRIDNNNSNTVFTASALGKLSPALTMMFNYQQSTAANQLIVGLGTIASFKIGLAYRDPEDDKLNLLLRYEYRQNPSIVPESLLIGSGSGNVDHTLAFEGIYAPNWQWEFYGKLALRNSTTTIASDFTANANIGLSQLRAIYRLGYNVELVGETRLLTQPTSGYSELGLVGEVGYYLTPNLRLAVGYSSASVNIDRDFSGTRSAGGVYAGLTVKLNELFDGFGLQKTPARQQQDPVEPVPTIAKAQQPAQKVAAIPDNNNPAPQIISLNVARSLTFKQEGQGNDLAISDIAILENLASILKEYKNLSLDIQGNIGSLANMNSGDNVAANRMMAARKYLIDRGVSGSQMTLRSLGGVASNTEPNKTPVSFALSGKADIFNAIATRLQSSPSNSSTTEFLQSFLPKPDPVMQANAAAANRINPIISNANSTPSIGVNIGNDGRIADLSYAALDLMIARLNSSPNSMFEIQTGASLSASAPQDLEMFKLLTVRSYLLGKGVSSDRILISDTSNKSGGSQVYISLNTIETNINLAATPPTNPAPQANATTTIPTPLASSTTNLSPLAKLLETDRPLSNWLDNLIANSQLTPIVSNPLQITNLEATTFLTQLPATDAYLLAIARPFDPALPSGDRTQLWSYVFEKSPTQLISLLLGDDLVVPTVEVPAIIATPTDGANRRLATALNFLLSSDGDTIASLLRAMGIDTSEKSGFVVDPDQLSNLKK
jgi:outer membrane protein OmpA-like peptidoglycan-associated protein